MDVLCKDRCKCGGQLVIIGHVSRGSSYAPRWRCQECRTLVGPKVCRTGGCSSAPERGSAFCGRCNEEIEAWDARETAPPMNWWSAWLWGGAGALCLVLAVSYVGPRAIAWLGQVLGVGR